MRREVKQHGNARIIAFKLPTGNGSRGGGAAAAKANGGASVVNCQMLQDSPPMAGADDRVLAKPSNHSKHPGKFKKPKCRECHQAATASKSRDKGKGALKHRSSDVLLNHRLASWRVVDKAAASLRRGFEGASASEILQQLSASRHSQDSGDDQKADDRSMEFLCGYGAFGGSSVGEAVEYGYYDDYDAEENVDYGYGEYYGVSDDRMAECFEAKLEEAIGPSSADNDNDLDDDDDDMDYFVVGMISEYSDGEDWIVVQEIVNQPHLSGLPSSI